MREKLLAAAAAGALLTGTAVAQTSGTAGAGAMTQQDIEELESVFEQAGFTDFQPISGAEVFRGMAADQQAAVIAIAPEGDTAGGTAGTTNTTAGSQVYQVTTAAGRTLLIVVAPDAGARTNAGTAATGATAATTTGGATTGAGTTAGGTTTGSGATAADTTGGAANAGANNAERVQVAVELEGSQQVPPVETDATGETEVAFDPEKRMLTWTLSYSGLSGEATAAHFHGPADPGETAPPVVPSEEIASGSDGSAELTEEQAEQLMAGKWYVNVHTTKYPDGEIRGQVRPNQ